MSTPPDTPRARHPARVRAARRALFPPETRELLDRLREVLCDPTRAEIVCALTVAELTVTDLAQAIGRSVPSTSQHLRILRQLGVVRSRKRGRVVYNALDEGPLSTVVRSVLRSLAVAVGTGTT